MNFKKIYFWQFIKAVGSHTVILLSGGFIVVALGLFERFNGRNVSFEIYGCVMALIISYACFLEWRNEREKRLDAETRLEKKVDIIFENTEPFIEGIENHLVNGIDKIIRVKVKNIGGETVGLETKFRLDSKVELFPLILKDRESSTETSFLLNPDEEKFINVAIHRAYQPEIVKFCVPPEYDKYSEIPVKPRKKVNFSVVVSGSNIQPCSKLFTITVGKNGMRIKTSQ